MSNYVPNYINYEVTTVAIPLSTPITILYVCYSSFVKIIVQSERIITFKTLNCCMKWYGTKIKAMERRLQVS